MSPAGQLRGTAPRARKPFPNLPRFACAGRETLGLPLLPPLFARAAGLMTEITALINQQS
jgi:hypothetical protein